MGRANEFVAGTRNKEQGASIGRMVVPPGAAEGDGVKLCKKRRLTFCLRNGTGFLCLS